MLQSAARVMAHDVFISYSSKDKVIADAVCARLEGRGIRCWIAPRDVRPGMQYGEEIIDAIHGSRAMVLVLSANANASPHIPKEVERAVSNGVAIIPLRVENVVPAKSLDYFISSVHWLDAIAPPLESHLDSLATTILTMLPERPQTVDQPAPVTRATIPSSVVASAARPKPAWLWAAIAVAVIVLAGAGWFFSNRASDSSGSAVSPPTGTNPPASPQPVSRRPAASSPSGADPILGCWHWMNNATVVINGDGTMTAGPFTARWRLADPGRRVYNFSWPEAVDSVGLSPDGGGLSGGNQYGVPMTATRVSPGEGLAGAWRWYNGVIVNIQPNGTFSAMTTGGHWQSAGGNSYRLTWPGPIDTVTMSSDHQRVSGANQYGFAISGTKMRCGG
jgi:hypothetical protein